MLSTLDKTIVAMQRNTSASGSTYPRDAGTLSMMIPVPIEDAMPAKDISDEPAAATLGFKPIS